MFPIGISSFSEVLLTKQMIIRLIISVANALLIFFSSMKFILVMQQCGYKGKRYFKWLKNPQTPYLRRLMLLCLLGFLFFCVLGMCFSPVLGDDVSSFSGFASYLLFTVAYIDTEAKVNAKVPLKKTQRLIRLCVVYFIVLVAVTFAVTLALDYFAYLIGDTVVGILRYSLLCGMPVLAPYILFVASLIIAPFETLVKNHYVKIATQKLKRSDVIKIGITGSYGKTSVKEILKSILSQKYRVLATPASYNTPLGIALAVKRLDSTHDIFIAEMGARNVGDIKETAIIVKPDIGVLTGVNSQHLESFGSIEKTIATKYELFENLSEGGKGFFSSDNENSVALYNEFGGEKYLAGLQGEDNFVTAKDVETDMRGTTFTLCIEGEKPVRCSTVLLGKHSIKNICLASCVCYKVGMTAEEIALGINRIQSVGHRLELVPNNKDIVVIDDSYNANEDGISASMEVLDLFEGRKIVVTPGLVELGKNENLANFELGKTLAKHADVVIIVGTHNAEILLGGLLEGGMKKENVRFASSSNRGNKELNRMLEKGDVVLFENDLPDNYN